MSETKLETIHPSADGFVDRVTPKKPDEKMFFFKCACGGIHYRHAGYVQVMLPFMRPGEDKRVNVCDERVMVCVACRNCFVWINEQMYDVTERVDLNAWEKTEREAHKATGPGGQC